MNEPESNLNALCKILINLARHEKKIEIIKEMLCQTSNFEPYTTFKRLDRNQKNKLKSEDIKNFLLENKIIYDEITIENTLFRRYSLNDSLNEISYSEFLKIVLPSDQPNLRTIVSQRPAYNMGPDDYLSEEIEYTLAKLLESEILCYLNIEEEKENKSEINEQWLNSKFNEIDKEMKQYIDFDDLLDFLKGQYYYPYEEEIISMLRRIDTNDDGRLTIDDFFILFNYKQNSYPKKYTNDFNDLDYNISNEKNYKYNQYENNNDNWIKKGREKTPPKSSFYQYKPIRKSVSPFKDGLINSKRENTIIKNNSNYFETKKNDAYSYSEICNKKGSIAKIDEGKIINNNKHFQYKSDEKKYNYNKSYFNFNNDNKEKIDKLSTYSFINNLDTNSNNYTYEDPLNSNKNINNNQEIEIENLTNFFSSLITLQSKLENLKNDLSLRPDFNLVDLFSFFDKEKKGFCSYKNFDHFQNKNNLKLNNDDILLFYSRFDRRDMGLLKFANFSEAFCPLSNENFNLINQRKPINMDNKFSYKELFSSETIRLISEIIKTHINNEKKIEMLKKNYFKDDLLLIEVIFNAIDKKNNDYINNNEFAVFLEKIGINFGSNLESKIIFERMDLNKDGKISFDEFSYNMKQYTKSSNNILF